MNIIGKKNKSCSISTIIIYSVLWFLALTMVYPFYNVLLISISTPGDVSKQAIYFFPTSFDLTSYKMVFSGTLLKNSMFVSLFVTVVGVCVNISLTVATAYALSKKSLPGRDFFVGFILLTMIFSGGIIPYYLNIKNLGLIDNVFVMILPLAMDSFFMIIMMNFFRTIPPSLEEAARIEGANDIVILLHIIIPISLPTIFAIGLFYTVARWNEWYHGMLFIINPHKQPMQYMLRQIILQVGEMINSSATDSIQQRVYPTGMKMAAIVLTAVPILFVYPFIQKHFTKGVMLGSVKG